MEKQLKMRKVITAVLMLTEHISLDLFSYLDLEKKKKPNVSLNK